MLASVWGGQTRHTSWGVGKGWPHGESPQGPAGPLPGTDPKDGKREYERTPVHSGSRQTQAQQPEGGHEPVSIAG